MSQELNTGQLYLEPQANMQPKKMDILFYNSINQSKKNFTLAAAYHLVKTLILVIFIPIDYTVINGPRSSGILAAMILLLIGSFMQFLILFLYRCMGYSNTFQLLTLSTVMGHSTQQPIPSSQADLPSCVSTTMYNQQNLTLITSQGLTDNLKQMYTRVLTSNIKEVIIKSYPCLNNLHNLAETVGFASFVYGIVALAAYQTNTPQVVIIIIVLVLEGLSKIVVLLVLVVIALLPVLCLLLCCVCCCCSPQEEETKLPEPQKATEKMINQADGTCTICYQNFIVGDNVVRLRCSPKHMFHPLCISGWTRLKATCPICRAGVNANQQLAVEE